MPKFGIDELNKIEKHFKLGVRGYGPSEEGEWRLIRHPVYYFTKMIIGVYAEHAFFIKDLN